MAEQTLSLRTVGSTTGHRIKRPSSWAALLEVASSLLLNHSNHSAARYVFDRQGDRIDAPGEFVGGHWLVHWIAFRFMPQG